MQEDKEIYGKQKEGNPALSIVSLKPYSDNSCFDSI